MLLCSMEAPGKQVPVRLSFKNPYPFVINFSNSGVLHQLTFEACFLINGKHAHVEQADSSFYDISLQPGEIKSFTFQLKAPTEKAAYKVYFSMRTDPFAGSRNSKMLTFTVK